jgi:hypothetical protein
MNPPSPAPQPSRAFLALRCRCGAQPIAYAPGSVASLAWEHADTPVGRIATAPQIATPDDPVTGFCEACWPASWIPIMCEEARAA